MTDILFEDLPAHQAKCASYQSALASTAVYVIADDQLPSDTLAGEMNDHTTFQNNAEDDAAYQVPANECQPVAKKRRVDHRKVSFKDVNECYEPTSVIEIDVTVKDEQNATTCDSTVATCEEPPLMLLELVNQNVVHKSQVEMTYTGERNTDDGTVYMGQWVKVEN
eukprot:gene27389-34097_t